MFYIKKYELNENTNPAACWRLREPFWRILFFLKIMKISFFTIRGRKQSQNKNINIKNYGREKNHINEIFNITEPAIYRKKLMTFFTFLPYSPQEKKGFAEAVYSKKPNLEERWRIFFISFPTK